MKVKIVDSSTQIDGDTYTRYTLEVEDRNVTVDCNRWGKLAGFVRNAGKPPVSKEDERRMLNAAFHAVREQRGED